MQGDFSILTFDPRRHERGVAASRDGVLRNVSGVLHQQGRVITDADLTEGELLELAWNGQAGRDIIGAGVCAVPASEPEGFRVVAAAIRNDGVHVAVRPGRAWVDGILTRLTGSAGSPSAPLERLADYFGPPVSTPLPQPASIADGVRDAVILEISEESLHPLQYPEQLLEPALGGPDTTERAFVNVRFRLLRLAQGEDCNTILERLRDVPSPQWRLTVSLAPPVAIGGDCPVVGGGGYTGFEHNLYRIETADTDSGAPARFKWSQWNGGLACRGRFNATGNPPLVTLDAGRASVINSGLTEFYVEALQYDASVGTWRVTYATTATLTTNHDLQLATPPAFGALPSTTAPVFLRLWNGVGKIEDFTNASNPAELRDGIRLVFDSAGAAAYRAQDYWTFKVRAGEISNPQVLVDHAPPDGIVYHRVPLAEITWQGNPQTGIEAIIEDCRKRFRPLTNQKVCCTLLVGDGVRTFGDFNALEEAAAHLPAEGGELCLLPGIHRANLTLQGKHDITIHGCSRRSTVLPRRGAPGLPILNLVDCTGIAISNLDLITFDGAAVTIDGSKEGACRDLRLHDNRIIARTSAIRATNTGDLTIAGNRLHLLDTTDGSATISVQGDDTLIERNALVLMPLADEPPATTDPPGQAPPGDPADPCARPEVLYDRPDLVLAYAADAWTRPLAQVVPERPFRALGGIHLRSGSERTRIASNSIVGGAGNGITLGGDLEPPPAPTPQPEAIRVNVTKSGVFLALVQNEAGRPVAGIDVYLEAKTMATDRSDERGMVSIKTLPGTYALGVSPKFRIVRVIEGRDQGGLFDAITIAPDASDDAAKTRGFLHEIAIQDNEISMMGLSGIGFSLRFGADLAGEPVEIPANDPKRALLAYIDAAILNLALTPLLNATDVLREVTISWNRIHHNLQNPFTPVMLAVAQVIGRGGISLGVVESAAIVANRIYENGPTATDPVCGIFVGYGNGLSIADNVVAANGAVGDDFEKNRREGLRGGMLIRFAGALTTQLSRTTGRAPALRVQGNQVDQTAGRALSAFAFGPVIVVGNHLNSEFTGRFQFIDSAVGGVLLINLGGMHRVFARVFRNGDAEFATSAELALPGGETVFDDNFIRLGRVNRSLTSQLIVCFDDLGYSGNTSSVYRPDPLLGNTTLIADSVRATSSRFREDATDTISLLTQAARLNMTSLNQADHCVVVHPAAEAPNLEPTVGFPNQVLNREGCEAKATSTGLGQHVSTTIGTFAGDLGGQLQADAFTPAEVVTLSHQFTATALDTVTSTQVAINRAMGAEAARLSARHGAGYPAAVALNAEAEAGVEVIRLLALSAETAGIEPPVASPEGSTVSGRFVNTRGQGQAGYTVDLLGAGGVRADVVGSTDSNGYFEKVYDQKQTLALARKGDLILRVVDSQRKEALRAKEPIRLRPGVNIHTTLTGPVPIVPKSAVLDGTVIFGQRPTVPPVRTPLSELDIDKQMRKLLNDNRIYDVEGVWETNGRTLARILGDKDVAAALRKRATDILDPASPEPAPSPTSKKAKGRRARAKASRDR
jgi:hypothetical protein